jgi:hypothetical protein
MGGVKKVRAQGEKKSHKKKRRQKRRKKKEGFNER